MTDTLVIIAIVLCAVILAVLIVLLVRSFSSKKNDASSFDSAKELGSINQKLDTLNDGLDKSVNLAVSNNINTLKDDFRKESEATNAALNSFKETINTSVNDSVGKLNKEVTDKVGKLNDDVTNRLIEINKSVSDNIATGFQGNSETMQSVSEKLGQIEQAQRNLESLQKQVNELNLTLNNNKTRGSYGEMQLEVMLENTFPEGKGKYYEIQKNIDKGVLPDAYVRFTNGGREELFCIDSKFPFANYRRLITNEEISQEERETLKKQFKADVRTRKDEVKKYIIPGKTAKYAVAFIPNDGLFAYIEAEFYDLVTEASNEGVIFACPSTLQAIIYFFHSIVLDEARAENIETIEKLLRELSNEFRLLDERWGKVSKQIKTVANTSNELDTTFKKINNKFSRIKNSDVGSSEEDVGSPRSEFPADDE